ncbi:RNA polymerase sigma factor [Microbacterium paludicola]|uniref:RNA polymerase sigma factor n=1 Tax=Microbacterium paludicola TaxID=300019 RepID=UPI003CD0572B
MLLRYFARRVTLCEDAADCTSETLLALWRHRSRLPDTEDQRRARAYGIARKVLANHHRGRTRRAVAADALRAAAATPVAPIPDEAFTAAEALKLLPARDQELIRLIIWESCPSPTRAESSASGREQPEPDTPEPSPDSAAPTPISRTRSGIRVVR